MKKTLIIPTILFGAASLVISTSVLAAVADKVIEKSGQTNEKYETGQAKRAEKAAEVGKTSTYVVRPGTRAIKMKKRHGETEEPATE